MMRKASFGGQLGQYVRHELKKPVDLPKLRLLCRPDLATCSHHPDFLHEGAGFTLRNEVLLAPVMCKRRCGTRRFPTRHVWPIPAIHPQGQVS